MGWPWRSSNLTSADARQIEELIAGPHRQSPNAVSSPVPIGLPSRSASWPVLVPEDRKIVSVWIEDHLRVMIVPYDDRDSLEHVEYCVLDTLDPPLNLRGRPTTGPRNLVKGLRRQIAKSG